MPSKFRFYYFNYPVIAEISRMLFALADVEYEDIRFDRTEWAEKYKALSPVGKCPWLEIDDGARVIKIDESHAIASYLATKFGFAGDDAEEAALALMYCEQMKDYFYTPMLSYYFNSGSEEATKRRLHKQHKDEIIPDYLAKLEKQLKNNQGGDGWLVGDKMTWADVYLAHWFDFMPDCLKIIPVLEDYPKLKALLNKVYAVPRFAKWMENRPEPSIRCLYEY